MICMTVLGLCGYLANNTGKFSFLLVELDCNQISFIGAKSNIIVPLKLPRLWRMFESGRERRLCGMGVCVQTEPSSLYID